MNAVVTRCVCSQSQLWFASRRETGCFAQPELHWTTYAQGVEQVVSNLHAGIYELVVTRSGSMSTVRTFHADEKLSVILVLVCLRFHVEFLQPPAGSPMFSF